MSNKVRKPLNIIKKIHLGFISVFERILILLPNEFSKWRVIYYNKKGCKIDKFSSIATNVIIKGKFEMGTQSSIAQNCTISGENAGVYIGNQVMIAPNVVIVAFNHGYESLECPMVLQSHSEEKVIIENNVWISSNTTIGKGVTIGEGSIVAANSFVNKSVPPFSIVGGVPAKVIKYRDAT